MPETKEDIGLVLLDYCRLAREGEKKQWDTAVFLL